MLACIGYSISSLAYFMIHPDQTFKKWLPRTSHILSVYPFKNAMLFLIYIYEYAVIIDVKLTKAQRVFQTCFGNPGQCKLTWGRICRRANSMTLLLMLYIDSIWTSLWEEIHFLFFTEEINTSALMLHTAVQCLHCSSTTY